MDRVFLQKLASKHAKSIEGLKDLGRWNQIFFEYDGPEGDIMFIHQYSGLDSIAVTMEELISRDTTARSTELNRPEIDCGREEDDDPKDDDDKQILYDNGLDDDEDEDDLNDSKDLKRKLSGVRIESDARIIRLQKRWKRRRVEVEDLEVGTNHPELMCSDCHRLFSSEAFRERQICRGPPLKKNVLSYCIQKAVGLYQRGELDVAVAENEIDFLKEALRDVYCIETFDSGWARRSACDLYGAKYIVEFKEELREMYHTGVDESSNKMCESASYFFSMPSEHNVL